MPTAASYAPLGILMITSSEKMGGNPVLKRKWRTALQGAIRLQSTRLNVGLVELY